MKAVIGNSIKFTAAIVLTGLVFSSTNVLAQGQNNTTIGEVGHGDAHLTSMGMDDHKQRRMILEAYHEERDSKKVDRFAHEARLQASKYKLSSRTKSETVY
jgi:hypothetical protein